MPPRRGSFISSSSFKKILGPRRRPHDHDPALNPTLAEMGDELYTGDEIHDLFDAMVNAEMGRILEAANTEDTTFTAALREELAALAKQQMKRAIDERKKFWKQEKHCNVYTLLTRESLATYRQINQAAVTISALGGGFTFTVIFSTLAEPRAGVTTERVRASLAVAWLLFVLAILAASFSTAVQAMREDVIIRSLFMWRIVEALLLVGAFIASAEAVRAYEPAVAITAFCLFAVFALTISILTLRTKFWDARRLKKHEKAQAHP